LVRALGNSIRDLEKYHGSYASMQLKEQTFATDDGLHTPLMIEGHTEKVTEKTEPLGSSHAQLDIPRACSNL
jgi:hypothetical protein